MIGWKVSGAELAAAAGWVLAVVFLVAALAAWVAFWRLRRRLRLSLEEAEQLRSMVKKRVERPNVFSHEVRTPLALIQGAAELLAEESPGPLNERQREFVQTITGNAQHMTALAEDLLTEARIESQLFELHLERVDLKALVRQVVRDARRIHASDIRFVEDRGLITVMGDRALLLQALRNLVTNACRHGGEGAVVKVSATSSEGSAIVSVTDSGAGMTREEREVLFEPFTTGGRGGGTGLGMMITQRIIRQHDGQVVVDSVEGNGTTILFTLPESQE